MPSEEMNEGRYPDKEYFWEVCNTMKPKWTAKYINTVMKNRTGSNPKPINKKIIKVGRYWQTEMKKWDYVSKCKLIYINIFAHI